MPAQNRQLACHSDGGNLMAAFSPDTDEERM
jgi:hypothetical protein